MRIWWRQTMWVVLVPPTTHIPSFTKIGHCVLIREAKIYLWWSYIHTYIHPSVHTYIQTVLQMKTKWSFQHSWRPTKKACWGPSQKTSPSLDPLPFPFVCQMKWNNKWRLQFYTSSANGLLCLKLPSPSPSPFAKSSCSRLSPCLVPLVIESQSVLAPAFPHLQKLVFYSSLLTKTTAT